MKIVNKKPSTYPWKLNVMKPGDTVQFEAQLHQKHAADAIFLVLKVPTEYVHQHKRYVDGDYRIMVANIETGNVSLVSQNRAVRHVNAEAVIDG